MSSARAVGRLVALAGLGGAAVVVGVGVCAGGDAESAAPAASAPRALPWVTALAPAPSVSSAPRDPPRLGNTHTGSFNKAKRAMREIYADGRMTLYCDCAFDAGGSIDFTSCGYVPKEPSKRASRLGWEHVVPAEAFGRSFSEWREGHPECIDRKGKAFKGRNCARKVSTEFRRMEADMYNLYPAIGEVNGRRSNYSMAIIPGEAREFGTCDLEIADRKIEPRPAIRGDIARTYLYMDAAYPGRGIVSRKNRRLFAAWAADDPVDEWECERARRIARIQRNVNDPVAMACRDGGASRVDSGAK